MYRRIIMHIQVYLGELGSGKGYESDKFLNQNSNYVKLSFADELRERAYIGIGYIPKDYNKFKERLLYLGDFPSWVSKLGKKINPNWLTGREYLQLMGDALKLNNKLFLTELTIKKIDKILTSGKNIVIDDLRFKHELLHLQRYCAEKGAELNITFCDYNSIKRQDVISHSSEKMSRWIKNSLGLNHLDEFIVDDSTYYIHNKKVYKVAVPLYCVDDLEEKDLLDSYDLNHFEMVMKKYRGE